MVELQRQKRAEKRELQLAPAPHTVANELYNMFEAGASKRK